MKHLKKYIKEAIQANDALAESGTRLANESLIENPQNNKEYDRIISCVEQFKRISQALKEIIED
jgi:hypothetical protein